MDRETALTARKYAQRVRRSYPDAQVILFGSRARGENWITSDYDFIVISRKFVGVPLRERIRLLLNLWTFSKDADVIGLTPKEFKSQRTTSTLIRLALRDGLSLN